MSLKIRLKLQYFLLLVALLPACSFLKTRTDIRKKKMHVIKQIKEELPRPGLPTLEQTKEYKSALKFFRDKDYPEALDAFAEVKNLELERGRIRGQAKAALYRAEIFVRLNIFESVILEVSSVPIKRVPLDLASKLAFREALAFQRFGRHKEAFKSYALFPANHLQAREVIKDLSEEEALDLLQSLSLPFDIEAYLRARIGVLLVEKGVIKEGERYLVTALSLSQTQEAKNEIEALLEKTRNRFNAKWNSIGLLLPLKGKYATIGENILNGFLLALGSKHPFTIKIIDTSQDGPDYQNELESFIEEEKPLALLGAPVGHVFRQAVQRSLLYGVPFITLSSSTDLKSYFVFQNALTVETQIKALLDHIATHYTESPDFGLLYPNDRFGVQVANLFWDEIESGKYPSKLKSVQTYPSEAKNFLKELQKMVGTYYLKDREEEYRENMKTWLAQVTSKRAKIPSLLKPQVDFKFLFLPDSLKALFQVAPSLSYTDIKGVTLVGTHLWNSNSLTKFGKEYVE